MHQALEVVQGEAAMLFAATIIFIVFFLIARVVRARQLVALAFAMIPLLLVWAAAGAAAGGTLI